MVGSAVVLVPRPIGTKPGRFRRIYGDFGDYGGYIIYWVYIGYILGIYWVYIGYILGIYWVYIGYKTKQNMEYSAKYQAINSHMSTNMIDLGLKTSHYPSNSHHITGNRVTCHWMEWGVLFSDKSICHTPKKCKRRWMAKLSPESLCTVHRFDEQMKSSVFMRQAQKPTRSNCWPNGRLDFRRSWD